jgi:hypothetical protein
MTITSPLKGMSAKNIGQFLTSYKGTKLISFPKVPLFFNVKS